MSITGVSAGSNNWSVPVSGVSSCFTGKTRVVVIVLTAFAVGLLVAKAIISYRGRILRPRIQLHRDLKENLKAAVQRWRDTDVALKTKGYQTRCIGFADFNLSLDKVEELNIDETRSRLELLNLIQPLFERAIDSWVAEYNFIDGPHIMVPSGGGCRTMVKIIHIPDDSIKYDSLKKMQSLYGEIFLTGGAMPSTENRRLLRGGVSLMDELLASCQK